MPGIPPAIDTDGEDVVWALQTAETLWKRNERVDAVVWLRRAAQSAGEAQDDDRAYELARNAAELAEWMANRSPPSLRAVPPVSAPRGAPEGIDDLLEDDTAEVDVDELLAPDSVTPTPVMASAPAPARVSMPPVAQKPPPVRPISPPPPAWPAVPTTVRTAAEAHAGMLDPWAENDDNGLEAEPPTEIPPIVASHVHFDTDEVVTSAPPVNRGPAPLKASVPETRVAPLRPPARVERELANEKVQRELAEKGTAEPEVVASTTSEENAAAESAPETSASEESGLEELFEAAPIRETDAVQRPRRVTTRPPVERGAEVDLSGIEAFGDLPDDARGAFANAATVQILGRDHEVSGFALAVVLEGSVDLCATMVDTSAQRLEAGSVLRARGTIDAAAPVRVIGTGDNARVATWDERAVTDAFRTCPWVEDELRGAGDQFQALVGITLGPLGERLDPALRADVTSRLRLRALGGNEVLAARGAPIPGFLVVGAGALELLGDDGAPNGVVVHTGEFLFPNEALRAAPAPYTVRAIKGGALVFLAERGVAQELIVTCPPLLEIFAEM